MQEGSKQNITENKTFPNAAIKKQYQIFPSAGKLLFSLSLGSFQFTLLG